MRQLVVLSGLVLLLSGCVAFTKPQDTVSFERVPLALALGRARAGVAVLESKAVARCRKTAPPEQRFDTETCQDITDLIGQGRQLDDEIEAALLNPTVEIDWGKVAKALEFVVKIAMKFI